MSNTPVDYENLNGLNVGDLIYNSHRDGMFIITLFELQRINLNFDTETEHPYILGAPVTLIKDKAVISETVVPVTLAGSRRIERKEVLQMVLRNTQEHADKNNALQELIGMTSI